MLLGLSPVHNQWGDESTKDEVVYARIFTAIIEHRLQPGMKLPEDALAESFEVSRTVIRKALQRLALERLVTIQPKRGATVAKPTITEAKNIFAARRLIEVGTLDQVTANISKADIAALKDIARQEHEAQSRHDHRQAINLSGQFHVRVLAIAGNEDLTDFLVRLVSRSSLIIAVYGSPWSDACKCDSHDSLIALLEAKDAERAKAWMQQHLNDVESALNMTPEEDSEPDFKKIFSEMSG
jgi:DNA-binding GntR family transcriptional regulator